MNSSRESCVEELGTRPKETNELIPLGPLEFISSYDNLDCHLTVGDPNSGDVEKIGVSRLMLLAHSTVFRVMLQNSTLKDASGECTHITDVQPGVFKLMLRHMYGCLYEQKDIPKDMAFPLALCADKYNIQPLFIKACQAVMPTGVEDLFPALQCVSLVSAPILESAVIKIVQEQTHKIITDPEFLELNDNAIEFVAKQEMLSVSEMELWMALLRWAKHKEASTHEVSLRGLMTKNLRFVRLATFSLDQILDVVKPCNILTPQEIVDLIEAVVKKSLLKIPGLCSIAVSRNKYDKNASHVMNKVKNLQQFSKHKTIYLLMNLKDPVLTKKKKNSDISVVPKEDLKLQAIHFVSNFESDVNDEESYLCELKVIVYNCKGGRGGTETYTDNIYEVERLIQCYSYNELFPSTNDLSIVLKAYQQYKIEVEFSEPQICITSRQPSNNSELLAYEDSLMKVCSSSPFHIAQLKVSV